MFAPSMLTMTSELDLTEPQLIARVRPDGGLERLGRWLHQARVLELDHEGFPFRGPGRHQLEGQLPWIFWDMCPSGYLGRRLPARIPSLHLAANPRDWGASDALRVLNSAGQDLAGNLLVGDDAVHAFERASRPTQDFDQVFKEAMRDSVLSAASSLGGERPKVLWRNGECSFIVKFAPPGGSPQAQRWSDLLRMEALCSQSLRAMGVNAVVAQAREELGRTMLFVQRFDRLPQGGRVAASTLYWLAADFWGDVSLPAPEVLRRLHSEGLVDAASVETCAKAHAFSLAIANNDAHLGNYGLLFDDAGRATLAPVYDVLPMLLAPRNDELPDAWLDLPREGKVVDPTIEPWVNALVQRVDADQGISADFKSLWRACVGL